VVKILGRDVNLDFDAAFSGLSQRMEGFVNDAPKFEGFAPQPGFQGGFSPSSQFQGGFSPQSQFRGGFNPSGSFGGGFNPSGGLGNGFRPSGYQWQGFQPSGVFGAGYNPSGKSGNIGDELFPDGGPKNPNAPGKGATGIQGDEIMANVDQWSDIIDQETAGTGIDGDIFRALIYNESNGVPGAHNSGGASGLLQLMPENFYPGENWADPRTNIKVGVRLMKDKIAGVLATYKKLGITRTGRDFAIDLAKAWLGGFDYNTGQSNGYADSNGTTGDSYAKKFAAVFDRIKGARASRQSAGASSGYGTDPVTGVSDRFRSIWGSANGQVMQEFGPTDYSAGHPDTYSYGNCFGLQGSQHPGLDVGLSLGTRLTIPVSGKVTQCGHSGVYNDTMGAGAGELRVQLDNGAELILGHMSTIAVQCGQRVEAGTFAGTSGGSDGAHVHIEYRIPDSSTQCGQRIVDPRKYI
jgi:murein DD-endopeptidase MepM/ murein hydrolase activator NlpD